MARGVPLFGMNGPGAGPKRTERNMLCRWCLVNQVHGLSEGIPTLFQRMPFQGRA